MGTDDFFTTIINTVIELVVAFLRIQYSAIFALIDAFEQITM